MTYPETVLGTCDPPFESVRAIVIVRGGGLGDAILALPAMSALHHAYPEAHITLVGTPAHAELLPGRCKDLDEVLALPGIPGEGGDDERARTLMDRFPRRVDLGVQLHGGGRNSNPLLLRLGARYTVGARTADAPRLERNLDYIHFQHAVLRGLEIVALAGATPVTLEPRVSPLAADIEAGSDLTRDLPRPVLAIHPGASDPRRRWPRERFAALARNVVQSGGGAIILGGPGETDAVDEIVSATGHGTNLVRPAPELTISQLVGAMTVSGVFAGNDSGPRRLAQALGTPTASVFWCGNMLNAGPLTRGRHRAQLSWTTDCPVCGRDATQVGWTAPRCAHDVSFVTDVPVEAVWEDVASLMATTVRSRGR